MNVCAVYGFETMSQVNTWKGNEFIALASDTNFDYPVGGFYTGYYAMLAVRHMARIWNNTRATCTGICEEPWKCAAQSLCTEPYETDSGRCKKLANGFISTHTTRCMYYD
jgi:Acetyl-CoA acetyltransferase